MGREIRKVPPNWEHPKTYRYGRYDYTPLFDESFEEACAKWDEEKRQWDAGERPDYFRADAYPEGISFDEWHGARPDDPSYYRPAWPEESRTAIQIYETVSEGTPVSPVFTTTEEAVDWVIENWGRSREAAEQFVKAGWAPSFVMVGNAISEPNAGAWEAGFLKKEEV